MKKLWTFLAIAALVACKQSPAPKPAPAPAPVPPASSSAPPPVTYTPEPPPVGIPVETPKPTTITPVPAPIPVPVPAPAPTPTPEPPPPFGGIPSSPPPPAPPPSSTPATDASLPCSGGKTVASVPLYSIEVGWDEVTADGKLVKHGGYPADFHPRVVYGIKTPSGKWTIFEWFYLRRIPAGVCLGSDVKPCATLGLETRALCGKDYAGKPVDRWPGKQEVNFWKLYVEGMTSRKDPAFTDSGIAKKIAAEPDLAAAWKTWAGRYLK